MGQLGATSHARALPDSLARRAKIETTVAGDQVISEIAAQCGVTVPAEAR